MAGTMNRSSFTAPGPGHWQADNTHWPRPCTRFYTELQPEGFRAGFGETCARYGLLLDHVAPAWVNGVMYTQPRPVADEQVPDRIAAAERVFREKLWREDRRRWEEEDKPASIEAHLALQAVEPRQLDLAELLTHLERCSRHLVEMTAQHHRYNGAAFVPVGDFLAHAAEWTGASHAELLTLVAGSAPASGGHSDELSRLITALDQDASARALVESDDDPHAVVEALTAMPGEAGRAAREYLELVGYRLLDGFDIAEPYALEQPGILLRAIRTRLQGAEPSGVAAEDLAAAAASVRERVPAADREHFDELLAEARVVHRLRDERGLYSDVWAMGLVRRALLAGGARLAASGRIAHAEHLVEAGYDEARWLLARGDGPTADELAARAADRASRRSTDAPESLGDDPAPPPPLHELPQPVARAMRAALTVLGGVFADADAPSDEVVIRGLAASPGTYDGIARLLDGPAQLPRLQPGDVLVTQSTSEAFNVALPLIGAIVTDRGGVLSHAAIVSRECGIPAVVGSRDATRLIPDGARVSVDGTTGEVRILR